MKFICAREIHIPNTSTQYLDISAVSFKVYKKSQPVRVMICSLHLKNLQFLQGPHDMDGLAVKEN